MERGEIPVASISYALSQAKEKMHSYVDSGAIVGGLLYAELNGEAVVMDTYGFADRERKIPMASDTIFQMRSMTKPLVGTAALMLIESGRLLLDDRVASIIPAFDQPDKRDITVYQLLTHTSGLSGEIYTEDGTSFATLREAVDNVGRVGRLAFLPGRGYLYSDTGSSTLGAVVEIAAGMPSEKFIHSRIIEPLGMRDSSCTFYPKGDARIPRISSAYRGGAYNWQRYWDNSMPSLLPFFRASGGLYSTAHDYAAFVRAIASGGAGLLSPETVAAALTPRTEELMTPAQRADSGYRYGFHWSIYQKEYAAVGPGVFGHGGSDGTLCWYDPNNGLLLLYLTQSRSTTTRRDLMKYMYDELNA
jgi:CubicO group peptidase (beta-lactamase class C family)